MSTSDARSQPDEQVLEHSSRHGVGAALEVALQFVEGLLDPLDAVVDVFVEGVVVGEGRRPPEFDGCWLVFGLARNFSERIA